MTSITNDSNIGVNWFPLEWAAPNLLYLHFGKNCIRFWPFNFRVKWYFGHFSLFLNFILVLYVSGVLYWFYMLQIHTILIFFLSKSLVTLTKLTLYQPNTDMTYLFGSWLYTRHEWYIRGVNSVTMTSNFNKKKKTKMVWICNRGLKWK